jgi:O-antigen/teichoic acid export membrane protein
MSALRRIARYSVTLLTGDVAARVLLFLFTVWVARRVGPTPFGLLTFAQAVLGYLLLVGDWGLATYGVREVSGAGADRRAAWVAITRVRTTLALVLVLGSGLIVWLAHPAPLTAAVMLATLAMALPLTMLPDWACRGMGRMGLTASLGVLQSALALAGVLVLVRGPEQLVAVPVVRFTAAALTVVAAFALLGANPWWGAAAREGREWLRRRGTASLLRSGAYLLSANAAMLAVSNADALLLKLLRDNQTVGLYGSAYRVIQVPMAAFYALTASALPVLTQLRQGEAGTARRTVRRLVALAAAGGAVGSLVLWFLRDPLIRLIYGREYAAAGAALGVLAFAIPLDFVVSVKGVAYVAEGREKAALGCIAAAAVVNIVANLLLIPRFGMLAAAWATVGTYVVLLAAYLLFLDTRRS